MKPFDLLKTPLTGTHLIEASAGTGKTYAIESLFVRLVLEEALMPHQILVVTFTQSATDELKDRIYRKLVAAHFAFDGERPQDDFIARFCAGYPDPGRGSRLVREAVSLFDRAAIFTIHGFCQRILYENAFETGKLFDTALIEDQRPLTRQIARDFWRRHLYFESPEIIAFVSRRIEGPDALADLLQTGADEQVRVVPQFEGRPATANLDAFRESLRAVRRAWPNARDAVRSIFCDPVLSGSVFGGVQAGSGAGGVSQRRLRVGRLLGAMDGLCSRKLAVPPLFKDFDRFTSEGLARATRKGQTTPGHDFFKLCDGLQQAADGLTIELENYLAWFKSHALLGSRKELARRKRRLNVQYFDDLLTQVKLALEAPGGQVLAEAVRRRFAAALVDEFQDTDRVQYDIFARFFARRSAPFFMIGDPKQAIYGFRGADVFTYMQAARQSQRRHTLLENWRSTAGLITAVNAIFTRAPNPFVYSDIGFEPGISAGSPRPEPGMPMTIWYLDSRKYGEKGRPVAKQTAEALIVDALAAEISSLLNSPDQAVSAGDIAVLVRTNRQARRVKDALNGSGIPAVLHSSGNIFESPEAAELQALLNAIAHPNDLRRLRTALVTRLWGMTAGGLAALDNEPGRWHAVMERVAAYHTAWQNEGFMPMFRQFLTREGSAVRLTGLPDGERRLTNLRHLAEILHRQAAEMNLNRLALVNWLTEQRLQHDQRAETHQLRMESDDEAVKIVTIHKSKGLEYPVVFCPFSWEDSRVRGSELQYHDPRHAYRATLNLDARAEADCRRWAQNEQLAENLRLLYVALTRARNRCYLVWGRIRFADTSALAYLLHARFDGTEKIENTDMVGQLSGYMSGRTDEDLLADLDDLAGRRPGCMAVRPLPRRKPSGILPQPGRSKPSGRKFSGTIDRSFSVISYSTMISRRAAGVDLPDHGDPPGYGDALPTGIPPETGTAPTADGSDMFAFEKGALAGVFFHDLFEQMDFAPQERESRAALVKLKLAQYGFEPRWRPAVTDLLQQVIELEFPDIGRGFHLGRLTRGQRRHEMEFYFALKRLTPDRLVRLLEPHFSRPQRIPELDRIKALTFSPARGFVKGFIDMVFSYRGKYYLVDWKSNHLGSRKEDYGPESLLVSMQEHLYGLQSLLYTLALDQYLRARLPAYRYETHFGGAYYLFVRGMRADWGASYGIFKQRPAPAAIRSIREALIPRFPEIAGRQGRWRNAP